jgi:cobalt/nickel transport system permease protein
VARLNESFIEGNSIVHRLDPRLRVLFAAGFAILLAVAQSFQTLGAGLLVAIALLLISNVSLITVTKRLAFINMFNLVLLLVLPLTLEGPIWFTLGIYEASREGMLLALRITLKSNAILMVFIALVATMSVATLGHTLHRLRLPDKLIYLLLISYRYLFVLQQEYLRLVTAARSRGFVPRTNLHTYRTYAHLLGMLLVRAMARADRVYQAMLCRGFTGEFHSLQEFSFTGLDRIWAVFLVFILVVLGGAEWARQLF